MCEVRSKTAEVPESVGKIPDRGVEEAVEMGPLIYFVLLLGRIWGDLLSCVWYSYGYRPGI